MSPYYVYYLLFNVTAASATSSSRSDILYEASIKLSSLSLHSPVVVSHPYSKYNDLKNKLNVCGYNENAAPFPPSMVCIIYYDIL